MKYVFIAGLAILACFIIALQFIPIGIEPLTEMYFENHTKLPKYIFLNKEYNFSFTINNLEYRDMRYDYFVNLEFNNKTELVDYGFVELVDNRSITIDESFILKEISERYRMNVTIYKVDKENESIDLHFWMEPVQGPSITIEPD